MPLIYNGVTYVQDAWFRITALDGASGKILWQFDPKIGLDQGGGSRAAAPRARSGWAAG